jgi:uncharacterized protein YmfQ (DUF2313 family)
MLIQKIAWTDQLQQLLPQGTLWEYDEGSNIDGLIKALQDRLESAEFDLVDLYNDLMPDSTTGAFLQRWEETLGLPNECSRFVEFTEDESRDNVIGKLNATGGQSRAYFLSVMEGLGYPNNTITEYTAFTCNDECDDLVTGEEWDYVWQINVPTGKITYLTCQGDCDDPLDSGGDQWLECLMLELKPAHTILLFSYGS